MGGGEISVVSVKLFLKVSLQATQSEILVLLFEGLSNKDIADRVKISYDTVRARLRHIYEKLHVRGRNEAVRKCLKSSNSATAGLDDKEADGVLPSCRVAAWACAPIASPARTPAYSPIEQ
jgi:DNA-binding CsgD family transcriptional regulator